LLKSKSQGEANTSKRIVGESGKKREFRETSNKNPKKFVKKAGNPFYQLEHKLTPLNTSVTKVFVEINADPNFKWPTKMRVPPQKHNNQKFCDYHNDHSHTTDVIPYKFYRFKIEFRTFFYFLFFIWIISAIDKSLLLLL
jgi:hypothetical protein